MTENEDVKVGGERLLWLFPDEVEKDGETVHFDELKIMQTKEKKEPWPVYVVTRQKDNDRRLVSGFALQSKEKFKATDLLHKDWILARAGTRMKLIAVSA